MPQPQLPTIKGRGLDYNVEQAIYRLQAAIGELSDRPTGTDPALVAQVAALERQVLDLKRQSDIDVAERIIGEGSDTGGGGDGGGGGGTNPTVPFPSALGAESRNYGEAHPAELANSCISSGGSWDYMDGLVAYLQGIDERVGFNGKRGNVNDPSTDAVSYYYGVLPPVSGSNDVYVIDVIASSCTPQAAPSWQNVTTPRAAGAWLPTRP